MLYHYQLSQWFIVASHLELAVIIWQQCPLVSNFEKALPHVASARSGQLILEGCAGAADAGVRCAKPMLSKHSGLSLHMHAICVQGISSLKATLARQMLGPHSSYSARVLHSAANSGIMPSTLPPNHTAYRCMACDATCTSTAFPPGA